MSSAPKHAKSGFLRRLSRFVPHVKRPPTWSLIVLTSLAVVLGGAAAAAYAYDQATNDRILPGVRVAGIDVSNMTRAQALRAVRPKAEGALGRHVTIHAGEKEWTLTLGTLGMSVSPGQAVDKAFDVSGGLSWMSRAYHRLTHHDVDVRIPLQFRYDHSTVSAFVQNVVAPEVHKYARSAAFELDGQSLVVQHSRVGQELKSLVSAKLVYSAIKARKPDVTLSLLTVDPQVTEDTMGETLTVDLSTNTLRLYDGMDVIRTYPVATAMYGFTTPPGEWEIVNKVENPTWYNPAPDGWGAGEPLMIPPGPGNPLGTRALYLNASGIRIHGTPSDSSIGTYASHGCIRMHIYDSEALYPLVPIGTKVIIFGAPPWGNISFSSVSGV